MNLEDAFRKTLVKWQRLAAGDQTLDPGKDCGLCLWPTRHGCDACPAFYHYGAMCCADAVEALGKAIVAWADNDWAELQKHAQEVVLELLSVKEAILKWTPR